MDSDLENMSEAQSDSKPRQCVKVQKSAVPRKTKVTAPIDLLSRIMKLCEYNDASEDIKYVEKSFVYNIIGNEAITNLSQQDQDHLMAGKLKRTQPIQYTRIHCTSCNGHLGSSLNNVRNMFVHPLMLVLMCKACFNFYRSGDFQADEDGSEMYCRWCGQGGQVLCCSDCPMVFCKLCVELNFDAAKVLEIENMDNWRCFICDPSQVIHLRLHCHELAEYFKKEITCLASQAIPATSLTKPDYSKCCFPRSNKRKAKKCIDEEPKKIKVNKSADPTTSICVADTTPTASIREYDTIPVESVCKAKATSMDAVCEATSIAAVCETSTSSGSNDNHPHTVIKMPTPSCPKTDTVVPKQTKRKVHFRSIQPRLLTNKWTQTSRSLVEGHANLQKGICSAALASSTFASSVLQLGRIISSSTSLVDVVNVYNNLQSSLSISIKSLAKIRADMQPIEVQNRTGALKPIPVNSFYRRLDPVPDHISKSFSRIVSRPATIVPILKLAKKTKCVN